MTSVLRVRTYLGRLRGLPSERERPASVTADLGRGREDSSRSSRTADDPLGRWEGDGGRLPTAR